MTKPKSKVITVHVTGPLAPYAQQFKSLLTVRMGSGASALPADTSRSGHEVSHSLSQTRGALAPLTIVTVSRGASLIAGPLR